ncbi:hypothetical protein [Spiroplasma endosymbiont of Virgichneumon dumeticola]
MNSFNFIVSSTSTCGEKSVIKTINNNAINKLVKPLIVAVKILVRLLNR